MRLTSDACFGGTRGRIDARDIVAFGAAGGLRLPQPDRLHCGAGAFVAWASALRALTSNAGLACWASLTAEATAER